MKKTLISYPAAFILMNLFIITLPNIYAIECGDTISTNTILTEDLINCPQLGLYVENVILDCNNHIIDGRDSSYNDYGIYLDGGEVKNCNIKEFESGIFPKEGSTIVNNQIYDNFDGIRIYQENNIIINNNTFHDNYYGIRQQQSDESLIENNNFLINDYAIKFEESISTIKLNSFLSQVYIDQSNNNHITYNHFLDTFTLDTSSFNTVEHNTFSNSNKALNIIYDSDNNEINNNIIKNNSMGIYLSWSDYNLIYNNEVENNEDGIYIYYSSNNQFYENILDNENNAYSNSNDFDNIWNNTFGNYWNDFIYNVGYPDYYEIDNDGIDYNPLSDIDDDGYYSNIDCNDNNELIHPNQTEKCYTSYDDNCNNLINEGCYRGSKYNIHME